MTIDRDRGTLSLVLRDITGILQYFSARYVSQYTFDVPI